MNDDCKHQGIDVCGCGMGLAECPGCGRHVDMLELGRGTIVVGAKTGTWVTVDRTPSMPLDEPKCSMMQATGSGV